MRRTRRESLCLNIVNSTQSSRACFEQVSESNTVSQSCPSQHDSSLCLYRSSKNLLLDISYSMIEEMALVENDRGLKGIRKQEKKSSFFHRFRLDRDIEYDSYSPSQHFIPIREKTDNKEEKIVTNDRQRERKSRDSPRTCWSKLSDGCNMEQSCSEQVAAALSGSTNDWSNFRKEGLHSCYINARKSITWATTDTTHNRQFEYMTERKKWVAIIYLLPRHKIK